MSRLEVQAAYESSSLTAPVSTVAVDLEQNGGGSALNSAVSTASVQASEAGNSVYVTSPSSVSSTTRRPSYTSKAPSALTNLPKTIEEINNTQSHLHTHRLDLSSDLREDVTKEKRLISTSADFENGPKSTASFESLDDYTSNPCTPQSNRAESPINSAGVGNSKTASYSNAVLSSVSIKRERASRPRNEILNALKGQQLEVAARAEILSVRCREQVGQLYKSKFGSGSKGKCIKCGEKWYTPIEFEALSGRGSCKDWKRSIRFHGQHLQKLIEDLYLTLHAISCTCGVCCGDETLTGPVKLFQAVKRKRSQAIPPNLNDGSKRKSISIDDYRGFRERIGSYNADNEVFAIATQDDSSMPPMTPVTPMTPLTPHTPFGAACMTPLATSQAMQFRSNSPPKSITLQVPTGQQNLVPTAGVSKLDISGAMIPNSIAGPTTPTKPFGSTLPTNQSTNANTDFAVLSHQHWIQLEEMASNFVSMANKMKLMVEQTRIQCEAINNSAITQAKIQAENEKQEALSAFRRGQFSQYQNVNGNSSLIADASVAQTQHYTVQVPRMCQNCSRDAFLECTGCFRVYYCGPFCQQKDWSLHKVKCRELAEEVPTPGAAPTTTAVSETTGMTIEKQSI